MKFHDTLTSKFLLGVIFSLFMLAVTFVFMVLLIPVLLVEFGAAFIGAPGAIINGILGLLVLLATFLVVGMAVFYFYKKNIFIYRKR
jgi:hypothetical protein